MNLRGHITEILSWNHYFIIIYNCVSNRYSQTLSLCALSPVGPRRAPWTLLSGNTYGMVLSSFKTLWNCICLLAILKIYVVHNAPVPLAGDATVLIRHTKKITDTQQDRLDGLVEHLRRYYFACVAYQLRINDAWVMHIRRMNGDATEYDVAYENLTIVYSGRKWRMHSEHPTNVRRSTRFHGVWRAYLSRMGCVHAELMNTPHNMSAVNVTFKCPCSWIHMYLNVLFHLSNLIMHVYHRNEIVLITGRIIC